MELTQILHRGLQRGPSSIALVDGSQRITYGELYARVARRCAYLQSQGITPGDRIALLSRNCAEAVELMFACWWAGAVFCPLNNRWSPAELADAIADCSPRLLVTDADHADIAQRLAFSSPEPLRLALSEAIACAASLPEDRRCGGSELAALVYTGGTTGRSKGVMLTHANLVAAAVCRLADNDSFAHSVVLVTTPIFHIASLTRLLPHLMAGGCCVLMPQFNAGESLALIEREGVTDLPVVPTMLQMLLEHPGFAPERLRSVRRLGYGAAPSASSLLQRAQRTLPWAGLHQYYGMTESSAIATMTRPDDHDDAGWTSGRATSAGQACALVEVRVCGASGCELRNGEIGEIQLRGPAVSPGYWARPEETARTFIDGWLRTGDAGRLDGYGYLHVVDRVKDMIVSGGENVYSAEVENALYRHPSVASVAVIGIHDERWGEAVHAVVVLRDGNVGDAEALKSHCRELIAGYKVPKSIEFATELPLTPTGKVAKNLLRERARARAIRRPA